MTLADKKNRSMGKFVNFCMRLAYVLRCHNTKRININRHHFLFLFVCLIYSVSVAEEF